MSFIPLDLIDLALAASLLILNAGLSVVLRLGLARQLVIAALRMVVQLTLLGLVLTTLFELVSPLFTALAALVMVGFAGYEVLGRQKRRLHGWWAYGLGTGAILFSAALVTIFALLTQIQPDPWYHPRLAIPLLGMLLGNVMTGVALGLDRLASQAARERAAIEAMLALGEPRFIALRPLIRDALRAGLIPIINSMAAVGLVSLPGMMTGQILAGIDPEEAIKYQMLIMFLIAGGTALGAALAVYGGAARLTDTRHRLRLDRLSDPG